MSGSCTEALSSEKKSIDDAGKLMARDKNVAICPRVTSVRGQYISTPQPVVMPAAASAMMSSSCTEPSSSRKGGRNVAPGRVAKTCATQYMPPELTTPTPTWV
jgi:hypothetical protein